MMALNEAKEVFINRAFIPTDDGSGRIYDPEKWREACYVISKWLEQEPKTGHWVEVTNGRGGHECDVCHDYAPSFQSGDEYLSPFCPNCGAKMVDGK